MRRDLQHLAAPLLYYRHSSTITASFTAVTSRNLNATILPDVHMFNGGQGQSSNAYAITGQKMEMLQTPDNHVLQLLNIPFL